MNEEDYERGSRAAWSLMLGECLRHLGYTSDKAKRVAWVAEREAAIETLRQVCDRHGDNEWGDDLHLADIIDKHLTRHLEKSP